MLRLVDDKTFQNLVRENTSPVIVYFTGAWCAPCKTFGPVVEQMAKRMKDDILFLKADMEEAGNAASELNIRSLPSLVLFEDGMVRELHSGTMSQEDLRLWIQENI